MFRRNRQHGFTLVEVLVVLGVVMLLAGALLGVGKYITVRAEVQLCESQLEVISTALEQYYDDHGAFPFTADLTFDEAAFEDLFLPVIADVTPAGNLDAILAGPSSAALFYCLDHSANSRRIIAALSGDLLTNKDSSGNDLKMTLTVSSETMDLVRFIDPWGQSIRYEYAAGAAFPELTSTGPDKIPGTADDIKSP